MGEAGPVTPALRSAAALLARRASEEAEAPARLRGFAGKALQDFPWGRDFWDRIHGDLVADFRLPAEAFFKSLLLNGGMPGPRAHYLAHIREAHGSDTADRLDRDLSEGIPSTETLSSIALYLSDQKHLWRASRFEAGLSSLDGDAAFQKDLRDLSALLPALSGERLASMRRALAPDAAKLPAAFSGAEIRVHPASGREGFDRGDDASVSLAYWIDGVGPKDSIEVSEAGLLDAGAAGVSEAGVLGARRKGPGPHTAAFRVPLRASGQMTFRLVLYAREAALVRREASFRVEARLDEALEAAGAAETAAGACKMDEAASAFAALAAGLRDAAGKPQFKAALSWAEPRERLAQKQAADFRALFRFLERARSRASSELCDFDPEDARFARSLLDSLPPGCDQAAAGAGTTLRAEIEDLLEKTENRRAAREAFRLEASRAEGLEASCRGLEAAGAYAAALARLDSDPAARCGALEKEYSRIRLQALPRAQAAKAFEDEASAALAKAANLSASRDFDGALAVLNPLIARIDTMNSRSCLRAQRREARALAEAAGLGLSPDRQAKFELPKTPDLEAAQAAFESRELLDKIEAQRRESDARRQEPASISPEGGSP
jgi:hypothetical protein